MNNNKHFVWVIILITVSLLLGFFIGKYYRQRGPQIKILRTGQNKINEALGVIAYNYVDSVNIDHLTESAVEKIVSELDPHSSYIPASEVDISKEDLESTFGGIGIEFNMNTDTILVISIISGGPAEKAGLMPFDRILKVNDSIVAGQNIAQTKMMRLLRGPKGSKVVLGIQRGNVDNIIDFELTRGDIPNYSIDVSYKISDNIGFIKVSKFARSTYYEFLTAIAKLKQEGVRGFIIDLRGNPGGYMEAAINMINEFLLKDQMIVYTQGNNYRRMNSLSDGKGSCQDAPLVVLIDELSCSASEIFSGAIQDNDRGLIIGGRSYGKGLVQTKIDLSDKSELLLTIARYYTPSGRCIQKEYELGKSEEYGLDIINRYKHGEFFNADSIKMKDSLEFKTVGGRTVYGGGGIMPDIFIPRDTTGVTSYYSNIVNSGVLYQFVLDYSEKNHDLLDKFGDYKELYEHLKRQPLVNELVEYAASYGIKKRPNLLNISYNLIERQLYAYIIRHFDKEGFFPIIHQEDATVNKAIDIIRKGVWRPEIYEQYNRNTKEEPLSSVVIPSGKSSKSLYANA